MKKFIVIVHTMMFLSSPIFLSASQQKIMPVFNGFWYDYANVSYVDTCWLHKYTYTHKAKTPLELSKASLHHQGGCSWEEPVFVKYLEMSPSERRDLPYGYNQNDVNLSGQHWRSKCLSAGRMWTEQDLYLYPSYSCPNGSMSFNIMTGASGCYQNETHSCNADILGRELDYPMTTYAGHVGLSVSEDYVLEFLNETPTLQVNHVNDFKNTPGSPAYWGAAYGLAAKPEMTYLDAYSVELAGFNQLEFDLDYTFTTDWKAGGYDSGATYNFSEGQWAHQREARKGFFRCDTFVNYTYKAGINVDVPTGFTALPLTTYASFLHERPNGQSSLQKQSRPSFKTAPMLSENDGEPKQVLQTLLHQKNNIDGALLDKMSAELLQSQTLSRQEKLDFLWNLAKENQDDFLKFSYVLDTLATLRPIELTDEMIALFDHQKEIKNQNRLLSVMTRTLSHSSEEKTVTELLSQHIEEVVRIQRFFTDLLKESTNPLILREAMSDYPSIVPAEQAKQVIDESLSRMQKDNINIDPLLLPKNKRYFQQLGMVFANANMQDQHFPQLLQSIKESSQEERDAFNQALYSIAHYLKPEAMTASVKQKLSAYLLSQKTKIRNTPQKRKASIDTPESATALINAHAADYAWLQTYALTQSQNNQERVQWIVRSIVDEADPSKMINLLLMGNNDLFMKMSTAQLQTLHDHCIKVLPLLKNNADESRMMAVITQIERLLKTRS